MQANLTIFQKIKKISLTATVVLLSLSALLSIFMILFGASFIQVRIIGTTAVLGVFSSLIVNNIARIDGKNRTLQILAWVALIASLIATTIAILMIWGAFDRHCVNSYSYATSRYSSCYESWQTMMTTVLKILWISVVVAINSSIVGRFLGYDASNTLINVFRSGTISCSIFLGVFFVACILFEDFPSDLWRLIVILIILLVLGLIVTPILVMVNKHRDRQIIDANIQANEQTLRAQIEQEVRAKIAAEEKAKATATTPNLAATNHTSATSELATESASTAPNPDSSEPA